MDWQSFLSPWNIGGGIFGLLLGIAAIVSLVVNRRQIGAALAESSAAPLFSGRFFRSGHRCFHDY